MELRICSVVVLVRFPVGLSGHHRRQSVLSLIGRSSRGSTSIHCLPQRVSVAPVSQTSRNIQPRKDHCPGQVSKETLVLFPRLPSVANTPEGLSLDEGRGEDTLGPNHIPPHLRP